MSVVTLGIEYFADPTKGVPVSNGFVYVGEPDTDPTLVINQKDVFLLQENGTLVPTTQPVELGAGGVAVYQGSPVQIITQDVYSIAVHDKDNAQVYYQPNNSSATEIGAGVYADLRATTGSADGNTVMVAGKTTIGDGYGGQFYWDSSDFSTEVTNDPLEKKYVPPTADLTGASGSWVRADGLSYISYDDLRLQDGLFDGQNITIGFRATVGDGGGGIFAWDSANLSVFVTADPSSGLYVAPTSDLTGASGAWVRQVDGTVSPKFYGAIGDGVANDTAALQATFDSGLAVDIPEGTYNVASTISMTTAGQVIDGAGKVICIITNTTNLNTILSFGDVTDTGGAIRRAKLSNLSIVGNVLTAVGVLVPGILDDGFIGDASAGNYIENVRITDVGAGPGLRVNSWSNTVMHVEIWDCLKGIWCGSECNSVSFINPYISSCTEEAVYVPVGPGIPSASRFNGGVYQRSGGTDGTIYLGEANSFEFYSVYAEGNTAPHTIYCDDLAHDCAFYGVMFNTVSLSPASHVIAGNIGKNNKFAGVHLLGGTIQNMVLISGTFPITTIMNLFVSVGTVTGDLVDDQSTRKATVIIDGAEGCTLSPTQINALRAVKGFAYTETDTGAEKFSILNGILYVGDVAGTFAPGIKSAGTTLQFVDNTGIDAANVAYKTARIGSLTANVKDQAGTGSPENAVAADIGSTFRRTDGGAGTTFYVKESGSGAGAVVLLLTSAGTVAELTTFTPHGLSTGATVSVFGTDQPEYLGDHVITVTGVDTFTYTIEAGADTPATGTITYDYRLNTGWIAK